MQATEDQNQENKEVNGLPNEISKNNIAAWDFPSCWSPHRSDYQHDWVPRETQDLRTFYQRRWAISRFRGDTEGWKKEFALAKFVAPQKAPLLNLWRTWGSKLNYQSMWDVLLHMAVDYGDAFSWDLITKDLILRDDYDGKRIHCLIIRGPSSA